MPGTLLDVLVTWPLFFTMVYKVGTIIQRYQPGNLSDLSQITFLVSKKHSCCQAKFHYPKKFSNIFYINSGEGIW